MIRGSESWLAGCWVPIAALEEKYAFSGMQSSYMGRERPMAAGLRIQILKKGNEKC